MELLAPDYYPAFRCIAGSCRHSCCRGWEIDIDEESLKRFRSVPEPFGSELRSKIEVNEDGAHFLLTEDERCPFLRPDGLCRMILTLGEDSLCQICRDHPRFRNYFSSHTEIGLGLTCEAAAELILTHTAPVSLISAGTEEGEPESLTEGEQLVLSLRDRCLKTAQDRTRPVSERIISLTRECGGRMNALRREKNWTAFADLFLSLECMDSSWKELLEELRSAPLVSFVPSFSDLEIAFEQLLVYLLFRYLPAAVEDDPDEPEYAFRLRLAYCIFVWLLIRRLCALRLSAYGVLSIHDVIEICRMYSGEIEYCEENVDSVINYLEKNYFEG